jgi:hypothetical protein
MIIFFLTRLSSVAAIRIAAAIRTAARAGVLVRWTTLVPQSSQSINQEIQCIFHFCLSTSVCNFVGEFVADAAAATAVNADISI